MSENKEPRGQALQLVSSPECVGLTIRKSFLGVSGRSRIKADFSMTSAAATPRCQTNGPYPQLEFPKGPLTSVFF